MTRRIYTRTGDGGETGLFGGGRVSKASARVEAYGAVDELNAVLGWAAGNVRSMRIRDLIARVQADLFAIGAHLATPGPRAATLPEIPTDRIAEMEQWMDAAEEDLPELREFILPGGSAGGSGLHLARTVCRRAERRVVALGAVEETPSGIVVYLNRLSDALFLAARLENREAGAEEPRWTPPRRK